MKTLTWSLALILLFAAPVLCQTYQVGDPVSDFTLRDSQGIDVSLSDYPDRIKFLVFWETT